MTSNFEKIMETWTSTDDLLSCLAAEVKEEARRRIEEPIRAELYTRAAEWLRGDLAELDMELAYLDHKIQALTADQAEKKRAHAELETAYHKTPFELKTDEAAQNCELARRAVFAVTEELDQLKHARTETFTRRQSTARALATVSKP